MPTRLNEDIAPQRQAHQEALTALGEALAELAHEAKAASKVALRGRPVDLLGLYGHIETVKHYEERCDLTALDIQSASGEDI